MKIASMVKLIGTVLAAAWLVGISASASAYMQAHDGLGEDECLVTTKYWADIPSRNLELGTAMLYANSSDPAWRLCQKKIKIQVGEVQMLQPLVIKRGGTGTLSTESVGGGEQYNALDLTKWFEITADGVGEVVFDASGIQSWTDQYGTERECAVTVDANSVRLTNIKVLNVNEPGKHAICWEGTNGIMDGVTVYGVKGDAFVFGPTAAHNWILPDGGMIDFEGMGIRVENASQSNGNRFIPTNASMGETDEHGFSVLSTTNICSIDELVQGGRNCTSTGVTEYFDAQGFDPAKFVVSKVPAVVQLFSVRSGATNDVIEIGGAIVQWDKEIPTTDNDPAFCAAPLIRRVTNLQVYTVNNTVNGFYGYVSETDTISGMGLTKDGQDTNGTFYFNMPKDRQIVIVPELTGHTLGQTSQLIDVADDMTQVHCSNGNTNAAGFFNGFGAGNRFISIEHCRAVRNLNNRPQGSKGLRARGYDTDGDGLLDDWEDTDRDCECESGETCWYYADTDFDGIPDGTGGEKACETYHLDEANEATYGTCDNVGIYDPDGDTIPNALDSDSDGDGRPDYKEDRNDAVVFTAGNEPSTGLLYAYKKNALNPLKVNNQVKECPLGVSREEGVAYLWYRVTRDASGQITAIDDGSVSTDIPSNGQPAEGAQPQPQGITSPEILVCRLQSLAWPHNFNGEYNAENNETNPYKDITVGAQTIKAVDTDNDGWCDGDNSGGKCSGVTANMNDKCPTVPASANSSDGCGLEYPCNDKQVFYTTNPDFVKKDTLGLPIGLKKCNHVDANDPLPTGFTMCADGESDDFAIFTIKTPAGKPNYLKVSQLCGDTDKDGIPDCVENPYGGCGVDEETGLKYNNRDSDGDTYQDGIGVNTQTDEDVCPGSSGPGIDKFVDSQNHAYSCGSKVEAMLIYRERPILSCFFDRDGDGLRDCEEDINQDGDFTKQQNFIGLDGIDDAKLATLETDPLDPDSDDDTLSDKEERQNVVKVLEDGRSIHTNPMAKDTDGDNLLDNQEDRDGDHMFVVTPVQGTEGCAGFQFLDTDPTAKDTDGDGLEDNIELDGDLYIGDIFINMILDQSVWGQGGGINLVSNPRSTDSDGDGKDDNLEYDGIVGYGESNPCMQDSDGDSIDDLAEKDGCALNPDTTCVGGGTVGVDSDGDGLADSLEAQLGTDPKNKDSDGDGLWDGINPNATTELKGEDTNLNGIYEPNLGEGNPMDADTDDDGLNDGMEARYGSDVATQDTDGDCILDGLEDANQNGKYEASETNALDADTDKDGLPDGLIRGIGEDLNCNGVRDLFADGSFSETDPANPDSDFDGLSDYDEMMDGGWNPSANVRKATMERGGGCSMVGSAAPSSMVALLGMLFAATAVIAGRRRQEKTPV